MTGSKAWGLGLKCLLLPMVALLLVGCGSDRPKPSLDVASANPEEDPEAEALRKEQMQLIRYFDKASQTYKSDYAHNVAFFFSDACANQMGFPVAGTAPPYYLASQCNFNNPRLDDCETTVCNNALWLCTARLMRQVATEPGTVLEFDDVRVEPQSAAANASLLQYVSRQTMAAASQAATALDSMLYDRAGTTCIGNEAISFSRNGATTTLAEIATNTLVEASQLMEEVTLEASNAVLAVADAELSSSLSPVVVNQRAITSGELSRAKAVKVLTSTPEQLVLAGTTADLDPGMKGLTNGSLCQGPDLTAQAQRALELIRLAAPPPDDVTGALTTESFMNSNRTSGSILQRLAQAWGVTIAASPGALQRELNLSTTDFEEARTYLKNELAVYARSKTHTYTTPLGVYARYPSTGSEPGDRDPAYWGAVSRYRGNRSRPGPFGGSIIFPAAPGPGYQGPEQVMTDYRYQITKLAAQFAAQSNTFTTASTKKIADPLALLSGGLAPRAPGFMAFEVSPTATTITVQVDLEPFPAAGGVHRFRIMKGEDGLHCATTGAIEGVPCTSTQLTSLTACVPAGSGGAGSPAGTCSITTAPTVGVRYYLVRWKNESGAPTVAGGGTTPGSFSALIGASPYTVVQYDDGGATPPNPYYRGFAIAPDVDREVARLLTPNKANCSLPRTSCAGAEFDERVPLENELSSDGDAVESSWRNYLNLAKAAAAEADQLGEAFISSQLETDLRDETIEMRQEARRQEAEAALAEFQELCGTDIDANLFLAGLSGASDPTDLSSIRQKDASGNQVTCTTDANCSGVGFACNNGICMRDPVDPGQINTTDPAMLQAIARAGECIGKVNNPNFTTLGNVPLCFWYPKSVPTQVCSGATKDLPCPVVAKKSGNNYVCTGLPVPSPSTNYTVGMTTDQLAYFSNPSEGNGYGVGTRLCDNLTTLRAAWNPDAFKTIYNSAIYHPANLTPLADRIGFQAYPGGEAAVTLDDAVLWGPRNAVFTTGALKWCPNCDTCSAPQVPSTCDGEKRLQWSDLNNRLMRAVIALRYSGGSHLGGVHIPFYFAAHANDRNEGTWNNYNYPGTATPINITRWEIPLDEYGHSAPGNVYTYHQTSVGTLPAPWITRDAANQPVYLPLTKTRDGKTFYFATGDIALSFWWPKYDNWAYMWWGGMSNSSTTAAQGGLYDFYANRVTATPYRGSWDVIMPGTYNFVADTWHGYQPAYTKRSGANLGYDTEPAVDLFKVTTSNLADAAELACNVEREVKDYQCNFAAPPTISHPRDYQKAKFFMECVAKETQRRGAMTLLYGLPYRAIDALRNASAVGSFPAVGGVMGEEIARLRGALVEVQALQDKVAYQIRSLGNDFEVLSGALERAEVRAEIADVQFQSSVSNQMSACGQALAGTLTLDFVGAAGRGISAGLTCANAFSQVRFAGTLASLATQETQIDQRTSITEFRQRFEDRAMTMSGLATELRAQLEEVDARLASIENNKNKARRALARALFKASSAASQEASITNVYGNRAAVAKERYSRAYTNAVRLAFLAKRAIETRLGLRLHDLTNDLPLVEAPATWESTLCASTGVDYTALKASNSDFDANTFADQYIGDYVRKLENVVESYRLENDFHEGEDISVVSLRDDVLGAKAECDIESRNLLYFADDLGTPGVEAVPEDGIEAVAGWTARGCVAPSTSCAQGFPRPENRPLAGGLFDPELREAGLFELVFTDGASELAQDVTLDPGTYVLSWRSLSGASNCTSTPAVKLFNGATELTPTAQSTIGAYCTDSSLGAKTYSKTYNITAPVTVRVSFSRVSTTANAAHFVFAPMLEQRTDGLPSDYQGSTASRLRRAPACADSTGEAFRTKYWKERCLFLCPNGYGDACDGTSAKEECFYEATFGINQRGIESGKFLKFAGFAKGNFNYRISDIGVNFIGTGILSCEESESPQSCYASSNIQYSLDHSGPYYVRNHEGLDRRLYLFEGHIEHARGLAAERYLTNPLSSSDNELLSQYLRTELRGRPLDGNFTLRVWKQPGLDFEKIQDVQLLLKYRYWTRFD